MFGDGSNPSIPRGHEWSNRLKRCLPSIRARTGPTHLRPGGGDSINAIVMLDRVHPSAPGRGRSMPYHRVQCTWSCIRSLLTAHEALIARDVLAAREIRGLYAKRSSTSDFAYH